MSITRLQQARQMYALGKLVERVGFRRGGTGGGTGDAGSPGTNADGSNANTGGGDNDYNFRGPSDLGVTTRTVDTISPPDVDRSAVGQFSTYGRNLMNQNLKGPSVFSQIGTGIKDYITGGGLIGAGIRGLGSLFGGSTPSTGNVGPAGLTNDGTYGTVGDAVRASQRNEPPGEQGDNQGIMATYIPNMLDTAEEDDEIDNSLTDFLQRFRVDNQFRQDKQGQLDPAIIAMINKLYT
jgi:hypothetical protein